MRTARAPSRLAAHARRAALLCALSCGCGATQTEPTTPRRELVIDEPTVVQGQRPLRPGELPPLPQPLESSSEPFRRGHALAIALIAAPGPGTPPAEDAAHEAWTKEVFAPWLKDRSAKLQALVDALKPIDTSPVGERVVSPALVGLGYSRVHAHLVAVPPPARVAADGKLTRIYQDTLNQQAAGYLEQASAALAVCAQLAGAQTESPYGLWLRTCQEERVALVERASKDRLLSEMVAAERKADRIAAEGARPEGPEVCWTEERESLDHEYVYPPVGPIECVMTLENHGACAQRRGAAPAAVPASTVADAPAPSSAAPKQACACDAPSAWNDHSVAALSPRDQRYGFHDPENGVRVSVALAHDATATMNARPLLQTATRHLLAECFAKNVREDKPVTVALHATLVVDARGKARSATLTPEPSDAAAAPSKALLKCVERALVRVPFACSASGQETQTRATFCMRRD